MAKTIIGSLVVIFGLIALLVVFLAHYPITPFSSITTSQSTNIQIQTFATPLPNVANITTSVNSQNSSAGLYLVGLLVVAIVCISGFIAYTAYNGWKDQKGRQ